MKILRLLIALASLMIPRLLYAQSLLERTDFSYTPGQSQVKSEGEKWQTDYYYDYVKSGRSSIQYQKIEHGVRQAVNKAQSGISISHDNSSVRTSSRTQTSQRQQEQYQREKEHQEWLNQRQAAIDAANEKRRLEEQRRQAEKIAKYNQAKENSLRMNAGYYAEMQNDLQYQATVGRDLIRNYRPEWEESFKAEFASSGSNDSKDDIASIVSRSSGNQQTITLTGHEHSTLDSDWDKALARIYPLEEAEIPKVSKLYFNLTEEDTSDIIGYEIKPIANGCGAEGDQMSHDLARIASMIEASHIKEIHGIRFFSIVPLPFSEKDIEAMEKYCIPHDYGYFYSYGSLERKFKHDWNLTEGSPLKGLAVLLSPQSMTAFHASTKENEMSRFLQNKFHVEVAKDMYLVPKRSKKP